MNEFKSLISRSIDIRKKREKGPAIVRFDQNIETLTRFSPFKMKHAIVVKTSYNPILDDIFCNGMNA